jgi:hypothetical protein
MEDDNNDESQSERDSLVFNRAVVANLRNYNRGSSGSGVGNRIYERGLLRW